MTEIVMRRKTIDMEAGMETETETGIVAQAERWIEKKTEVKKRIVIETETVIKIGMATAIAKKIKIPMKLRDQAVTVRVRMVVVAMEMTAETILAKVALEEGGAREVTASVAEK